MSLLTCSQLALKGIYFAFLVPSINYLIAFSKKNLCTDQFDFRSNKIAIIRLRVILRFGFFVFYRNIIRLLAINDSNQIDCNNLVGPIGLHVTF